MVPSEQHIERQTYEYSLSDFTNTDYGYAFLQIEIPGLDKNDIVIANFSWDSATISDEQNYFTILKNGAVIDTTRSEEENFINVYINNVTLNTVPDTARIWLELVIFYR